MPYRITPLQVGQIMDLDPNATNLTPFIAAAEQLVNRVCGGASTTEDEDDVQTFAPAFQVAPSTISPIVYTPQELAVIETWLAAHFVAIRFPLYTSQSLGPASGAMLRQGGMNLAQTPFGQQAMLLDINGGLAWLDKHISQGNRAKVGITYLGTNQRAAWYYGYPWRFYALGTG
jgi:hypothetical protein